MFDTNTMIKVGGLVAITIGAGVGSYFLGRHNGYKKGQQEKAPEAPAPEAKAK